MRILWFSNTPSLAAKKVSKNTAGGSWIESLEKELSTFPEIELAIAFKHVALEVQEIEIEDSKTRYFMVPQYPNTKLSKWTSRCFTNLYSEKSIPHYLKVVDNFQPDLILFFGTEFDYPMIIPQINIPSIIWFQGNLTVYNEMYESGIRLKKAFSFESLKRIAKCSTVYHEYRLFHKRVQREKQIFKFAENFIGRTDWDKRVVQIMAPQANYFHSEEALREPFWKHIWSFQPNRKKFIVTTVIRGLLYKGLETVYKTSALLEDILGDDFEWQVVGISEGTTYVKAARNEAGYGKERNGVKLLGSKFGEDLVHQLLNANVYVHPSHIENSSNAVQEAMLLGMPVIATNVGGTPSLFKDGEEGVLVQSKDPYAMAGAILELVKSPDKAISIGERARKLGMNRNDNKKICTELIDTFNQVIQAKNK